MKKRIAPALLACVMATSMTVPVIPSAHATPSASAETSGSTADSGQQSVSPHFITLGSLPDGNEFSIYQGGSYDEAAHKRKANKGEQVTLQLKCDVSNGYAYDTTKNPAPVVTTASGKAVTLTSKKVYKYMLGKFAQWTFIMPDEDITVAKSDNLLLKYESHTVSVDASSRALVSTPVQQSFPGAKFDLTLKKPAHGHIKNVIVAAGDKHYYYAPPEVGSSLTIAMPDSNITVSATESDSWFDEGNYDQSLYESPAGDWNITTPAQFAAFMLRMQKNKNEFNGKIITIAKDLDMSAHEWQGVKPKASGRSIVTIKGENTTIKGVRVTESTHLDENDIYSVFGYFNMILDGVNIEANIDAQVLNNQKDGGLKVATFAGFPTVYNSNIQVNMNVHGDSLPGYEPNTFITSLAFQPLAPQEVDAYKGHHEALKNTTLRGGVQVSNCSLKDVAISSFNSASGSNAEENTIKNNAFCTSYTVGDNVSFQSLKLAYIAQTAPAQMENNYYGGTVTLPTNKHNISQGIFSQLAWNKSLPSDTYLAQDYPLSPSDSVNFGDKVSKVLDKQQLQKKLSSWAKAQDAAAAFKDWSISDEAAFPVFEQAKQVGVQHTIESQAADHGTVTLPNKAAANDVVNVLITPEARFELATMKIYKKSDASKTPLQYTKVRDNAYTFVMPDDDVVVEPQFKTLGSSITANVDGEGTVTCSTGNFPTITSAPKGETVNVALAPKDGHALQEFTVLDSHNQPVPTEHTDTLHASFIMPDNGVTISAKFIDSSSWYKADKSLKPGQYVIDTLFGSSYMTKIVAQGGTLGMQGAMGYSPAYSKIHFSITDDGDMFIDSWKLPDIKNPLGMVVGLSDIKVATSQWGNTNNDHRVHDLEDGPKFNSDNYKSIDITDVKSWYTAPIDTGIRTAYTGEAHKVEAIDIEAPNKHLGAFYSSHATTPQKIAGMEAVDGQIFPAEVLLPLPKGVAFRNTGNLKDEIIHMASFICQMKMYAQVMMHADFKSIQKVADSPSDAARIANYTYPSTPQGGSSSQESGSEINDQVGNDTLPNGTYTVPVQMLRLNGNGAPSMGAGVLTGKAKLIVTGNTLRCEIPTKPMVMGNIRGHLMKLYTYPDAATSSTLAQHQPIRAQEVSTASDVNSAGAPVTYPNLFAFEHSNQPLNELFIRVNVDAMGGDAGEQNAVLKFDWSALKLDRQSGDSAGSGSEGGSGGHGGSAGGSEGGTPEEPSVPSFDQATKRIAGETAEDTMQQIVQTAFPDPVDKVVLATSESYWDALSANSLAGSLNAPVLLTHHNQLPAQTIAELKRLKTSKVVVCGGENAISNDVVSQLKDLNIEVERIAGNMASDTANDIAKKLANTDTAVVTTSWGYEDALSAASFAYAKKAPIFLANYNSATLDASSIQTMKDKGVKKVYIVGGTSVVSPEVEAQLSAAGITVERIAGDTAYDTSAKLATKLISLGMSANNMAIATGWGYTDALAGAALCGKQNSVMVLADNTNQTAINDVVAANKNAIQNYYIFGGTSVVGDSATNALKGVFTGKDA